MLSNLPVPGSILVSQVLKITSDSNFHANLLASSIREAVNKDKNRFWCGYRIFCGSNLDPRSNTAPILVCGKEIFIAFTQGEVDNAELHKWKKRIVLVDVYWGTNIPSVRAGKTPRKPVRIYEGKKPRYPLLFLDTKLA